MLKLETESGDNWTVIVFSCPKDKWPKVLVDLFNHLEGDKRIEIPHYTIRKFCGNSIIVSLRIFRNPKYQEEIKEYISNFMKTKNLVYRIDPSKGEQFWRYHAWIRKGENNLKWNRERCEALNRLSQTTVFLAKNSIFTGKDRAEFAHLFTNMLALQEAHFKNRGKAGYADILNNQCYPYKAIECRLPNV